MTGSTPEDEVQRRVRRAVGLKVLRDTAKLAQSMEHDDRRRPQLMLRLILLVLAIAVLAGVLIQFV